jgi:hypothetical protein
MAPRRDMADLRFCVRESSAAASTRARPLGSWSPMLSTTVGTVRRARRGAASYFAPTDSNPPLQ